MYFRSKTRALNNKIYKYIMLRLAVSKENFIPFPGKTTPSIFFTTFSINDERMWNYSSLAIECGSVDGKGEFPKFSLWMIKWIDLNWTQKADIEFTYADIIELKFRFIFGPIDTFNTFVMLFRTFIFIRFPNVSTTLHKDGNWFIFFLTNGDGMLLHTFTLINFVSFMRFSLWRTEMMNIVWHCDVLIVIHTTVIFDILLKKTKCRRRFCSWIERNCFVFCAEYSMEKNFFFPHSTSDIPNGMRSKTVEVTMKLCAVVHHSKNIFCIGGSSMFIK